MKIPPLELHSLSRESEVQDEDTTSRTSLSLERPEHTVSYHTYLRYGIPLPLGALKKLVSKKVNEFTFGAETLFGE